MLLVTYNIRIKITEKGFYYVVLFLCCCMLNLKPSLRLAGDEMEGMLVQV